jgi:hypothetical protein
MSFFERTSQGSHHSYLTSAEAARTDVLSEMPLRGREEDESECYPDTYREEGSDQKTHVKAHPEQGNGPGS